MDNNKKHQFSIVDLSLVDQGLEHFEAMIVAYVIGWEKSTGLCCAGIPHIAKDLRLSERSVRRYIKRLIVLGYHSFMRLRPNWPESMVLLRPKWPLRPAKMATNCGQIGRL